MASLRRTRARNKNYLYHGPDANIEKSSYSPSLMSRPTDPAIKDAMDMAGIILNNKNNQNRNQNHNHNHNFHNHNHNQGHGCEGAPALTSRKTVLGCEGGRHQNNKSSTNAKEGQSNTLGKPLVQSFSTDDICKAATLGSTSEEQEQNQDLEQEQQQGRAEDPQAHMLLAQISLAGGGANINNHINNPNPLLEACSPSPVTGCARCRRCTNHARRERGGRQSEGGGTQIIQSGVYSPSSDAAAAIDGETKTQTQSWSQTQTQTPSQTQSLRTNRVANSFSSDMPEYEEHDNKSSTYAKAKSSTDFQLRPYVGSLQSSDGSQGKDDTDNISKEASMSTLDHSPPQFVEVTLDEAIVRLKETKLPKKCRKYYTWEEVKTHTTRESCWIVVHKKVYDVTRFLSIHPAGEKSILRCAGTDCTRHYYFHSKRAQKLFSCFCIGYLTTKDSQKVGCSMQ